MTKLKPGFVVYTWTSRGTKGSLSRDRASAAKRADPSADVRALEREIDQRVYALYGLTPDEIKIVKDSTW
jgi:hypothetical protein